MPAPIAPYTHPSFNTAPPSICVRNPQPLLVSTPRYVDISLNARASRFLESCVSVKLVHHSLPLQQRRSRRIVYNQRGPLMPRQCTETEPPHAFVRGSSLAQYTGAMAVTPAANHASPRTGFARALELEGRHHKCMLSRIAMAGDRRRGSRLPGPDLLRGIAVRLCLRRFFNPGASEKGLDPFRKSM